MGCHVASVRSLMLHISEIPEPDYDQQWLKMNPSLPLRFLAHNDLLAITKLALSFSSFCKFFLRWKLSGKTETKPLAKDNDHRLRGYNAIYYWGTDSSPRQARNLFTELLPVTSHCNSSRLSGLTISLKHHKLWSPIYDDDA